MAESLRFMGVHIRWFVSSPRPDIFRTTRENHNIIGGVDTAAEVNKGMLQDFHDWATSISLGSGSKKKI